jgi:large subunit ribosomal protein L19e
MAMNTVRRIASEILGVGESKIKFNPEATSKIGEALTREDIRGLIQDGSIVMISPRGVSRVRGMKKQEQKRKGRRSGTGSKKGTFKARLGTKEHWIAKIRSQRRYLRSLIDGKSLKEGSSRKIYMMVKGNAFKSVKIMETYLRDNKFLVEKAK